MSDFDYSFGAFVKGLELCRVRVDRRAYLESHWEEIRPYLPEYVETIASAWPDYPEEGHREHYPEGMPEHLTHVLFVAAYCCLFPKSWEIFQEKGYPREIWLDNIQDLNWHSHSDADGGNFWTDLALPDKNFGWPLSILTGQNITLGRLQFYPGECPIDTPYGVKKGDKIVGFHIPANGPLDTDACIASFRRARVFFAEHFPEWDFKAFFCRSWFLNTNYRRFLPPTSNIIRFQDLGKTLDVSTSMQGVLERVFNYGREDVNTPNPRTTLQRAVQQMMKEGIDFTCGSIVISKDI